MLDFDWKLKQESAWNAPAVTDTPRRANSDPLQRRERVAAEAFARGPEWFAKRLLEWQHFPSNRNARVRLIEKSRKLLAESRAAIQRTKSTLAFRSRGRKHVS